MKVNDFVERLSKRYPKSNEIEIDDLKDWLDLQGFKSLELDTLYNVGYKFIDEEG